jgi:hypothetical protein
MVVRAALLVLLVGSGAVAARADQWAFFHPELVTQFSCTVSEVRMSINGTGQSDAVWEAEASATRKAETDWGMTVGVFPLNLKGRHAAEKACSRWMDGASKRVTQAHQ